MTSVVKPGPPRVIVQMRSKVRRPPMNESRMTVKVAFRLRGMMTCRKLRPGAALEADGVDVLLGDGEDARDEDDERDADALPDVHERDREERDGRVGQPGRAVDADDLEDLVDEALGRMHEDGEGDAHGHGADQDREEDDRAQQVAEPHARRSAASPAAGR